MPASPLGPPALPGYSAARFNGSGELVDVYTAEQLSPRRPVLLTVLHRPLETDEERERFRTAADQMALVSAHPSVLTVLQASIAVDGRPYIVSERCIGHIAENGRVLGLEEVLALGVRIGSALETLHRAGVLHGGVRPHHLLVTPFGSIVLAATGLSAALAIDSVPSPDAVWTAPEVRDGRPLSVAADVHGLGATLLSLLGPTPVPPALRRVLERSTALDPSRRHGSALELVLELRETQAQLRLPVTAIEVALDGSTALDARAIAGSERPEQAGHRGIRFASWALLAAAVAAIAIGASSFAGLSRSADAAIPVVEGVQAVPADGAVEFSWDDAGLADGDRYQARLDGGVPRLLDEARLRAEAPSEETVCLSVVVNRDGRMGPPSEPVCAAPAR